MAEVDVSVNTEELRSLLEDSHSVMKDINRALTRVDEAFKFYAESDVMEGKAAKGLKDFISVISEEVVFPSIQFNDKLFKSLKTINNEFEIESYRELS